MQSTQRTGAVSWSARSRLASGAGPHRLAAGVGDDRKRRVGEGRAGERLAQPVHRRRHERRVERAAHLERQHPLGAARLAPLAGAVDAGGIAGDDGLVGRVEVGGHRAPPSCPRPRRRRPPPAPVARPSTAAMAPGRSCPASSISSPRRRTSRAASAAVSVPRGDVGAVLAQAVSRAAATTVPSRSRHDREHRGRVGEDRGLRVVGQGELVLGALPHEAGERARRAPRRWPRRCRAPRESARRGPSPCRPAARPGRGTSARVTTGRRRSPR